MGEPADFIHIFDAESGYAKCQEIDLFGEITVIRRFRICLFFVVAAFPYGFFRAAHLDNASVYVSFKKLFL